MLQMLSALLLGGRRTGLAGLFPRRRHAGGFTGRTSNRGASALGTIATIAAPLLIRRLMARRARSTAALAR